MTRLILIACVVSLFSSSALAYDVYVRPYYRNDGSYVNGHYRTNPDGNVYNNYSTQGNYNPYKGTKGTVNPYNSDTINRRYNRGLR